MKRTKNYENIYKIVCEKLLVRCLILFWCIANFKSLDKAYYWFYRNLSVCWSQNSLKPMEMGQDWQSIYSIGCLLITFYGPLWLRPAVHQSQLQLFEFAFTGNSNLLKRFLVFLQLIFNGLFHSSSNRLLLFIRLLHLTISPPPKPVGAYI
jgi:hypothetical protein